MSDLELQILKILQKERLHFEREKTFSDLRGGRYRYDFYVITDAGPVLIEIDGIFHFKDIHGRAVFMKQQEHDREKNSYALANRIPLYRIPYWEMKNITSFKDMTADKFLVRNKWYNDELIREFSKRS